MGRYVDVDYYCNNICKSNKEKCDKRRCPILNTPAADVVPREKLVAAVTVLNNHGIHVEGIN